MKDILAHHGILGQKWGKRNGPPYPLTYDKHSNSEKQKRSFFGVSDSLHKINNDNIGEKSKIGSSVISGYSKVPVSSLVYGSESVKWSNKSEIMSAYTAAIGDYDAYIQKKNSPDFIADTKKEKAWSDFKSDYAKYYEQNWKNIADLYNRESRYKALSEIPKMDKPTLDINSVVDNMRKINNNFASSQKGRNQNCMFCTSAMAMRMKGYDIAADLTPVGFSCDYSEKWFNGAKLKKPLCKTQDELISKLKNEGEGAYGNLMVELNNYGGHSVFWYVHDKELYICDCQSGSVHTNSPTKNTLPKDIRTTDLNTAFSAMHVGQCMYTVLTDLQPNQSVLGCLSDVGSGNKDRVGLKRTFNVYKMLN